MSEFSKYPNSIDSSNELPKSTDLKTPVKAEVVNRLREAILNIENELGVKPSGTFGTVVARLNDLTTKINGVATGNAGGDLAGTYPNPRVAKINGTSVPVTTSAEIGKALVVTAAGVADWTTSVSDTVQVQEAKTVTNGQTSFTLNQIPSQATAVQLFVNGVKQLYGTDYTAFSTIVTWNNTFTLKSTDKVEFWYLVGGGSVPTPTDHTAQIQETKTVSDGQTSFTLNQIPAQAAAVQLFVDGVKQLYGTDYTVLSNIVTWNDNFTLNTTNQVEFWYLISIGAIAGSPLEVQSNGTSIETSTTRLNFTGAITVTNVGSGQLNIGVSGGFSLTSIKTSLYTAAIDEIVRCDSTGGGFSINLPTAIGKLNQQLIVKNIRSSVNPITIVPFGSETIDEAVSKIISAAYLSLTLISDNSNWIVI